MQVGIINPWSRDTKKKRTIREKAGKIYRGTDFSKMIDELSLPELIEVSDVVMANSKGIKKNMPKTDRARKVAEKMQLIESRNHKRGNVLINRVNHEILRKNKITYSPSEEARIELRKMMEEDE